MKLLDYDLKFKDAPLAFHTCLFICTVTTALNSLQPLRVCLLIFPVPAISFISLYFLQSTAIFCAGRGSQMWLRRQQVNQRNTTLYSRALDNMFFSPPIYNLIFLDTQLWNEEYRSDVTFCLHRPGEYIPIKPFWELHLHTPTYRVCCNPNYLQCYNF